MPSVFRDRESVTQRHSAQFRALFPHPFLVILRRVCENISYMQKSAVITTLEAPSLCNSFVTFVDGQHTNMLLYELSFLKLIYTGKEVISRMGFLFGDWVLEWI